MEKIILPSKFDFLHNIFFRDNEETWLWACEELLCDKNDDNGINMWKEC